MSTSEVHELAVKLTPEGGDDVQQTLDNTSEKFEETADRSEEAAQDLNRFSRKFVGALTVASGILGGVTAGFLSRIPAVQDAFISVGSVVDGLISTFSEDFGDAIRDVSDRFFELGQDVRTADSFLESLGVAAVGTEQIINDVRASLLRTAGSYSVELAVDVVTRLRDPSGRQRLVEGAESALADQFDPGAVAARAVSSMPFFSPAGQFGRPFAEGVRNEIADRFEEQTGREFPGVFGGLGPRSIDELPMANAPGSGADFGLGARAAPGGASFSRTSGPTGRVETETGDEQLSELEQIRRLLQDNQRLTSGRDTDLTADVTVSDGQLSPVEGSLTSGGT